MGAKRATSGLKALSLAYLAGASAFGFTIALQQNQQWAVEAKKMAQIALPAARDAAEAANQNAVKPALAWAGATTHAIAELLNPPAPQRVAVAAPRKAAPPVLLARPVLAPPPALRPAIGETPQNPVAVSPPLAAAPPIASPGLTAPSIAPAPDASGPGPVELARVLGHLKVSLTREMYDNFDLFLYVSKADRGPWSQRMYVFQKQANGDLTMLYDWPVSTGRELDEIAPNGMGAPSITPQGYYEIDPDRMYRGYHSMQWDQPMPYAMFFTWEHEGLQTGLAIHGASGADIALLGKRSSAGCVRLAPQNAQLLFRLIRADFKGLAPRFAYDRRTATMSNDGLLMHDKAGNLQYAEGYKVLVFIENNGGDNIVAALF